MIVAGIRMIGLLLLASLPAGAGGAGAGESAGSSPVMVELQGGTRLVAAIDARTNRQTLWLRFGGTTATLYRGVDWQEVVGIWHDGQVYRGAAMRELSSRLSTLRMPPERTGVDPRRPNLASLSTPPVLQGETPAEIPAFPPRLQVVQTDAYVANWDADVEIDGIVLWLTTLDEHGHPVPVHGTVTVELRGDRRSRTKPPLPQRRYADERLGYWRKTLPAAAGGETVFLLPFQALHPEFELNLAARGLLHVKLVVPGQGVFEDSIADLTVRPLRRIRDQIQQSQQGSRYLPIERTGRGAQLQ